MSYLTLPFVPAFSNLGLIAAGAKLYSYITLTTTPTPLYADADLTTPLSNPIIADAAGRFPAMYLDDTITYRLRLLTAAGVFIDEADPVSAALLAQSVQAPDGGTVAQAIAGTVTPEQFGAIGDAANYPTGGAATDDTAALQAAYDSGKSVFLSRTYLSSGNTLTTSNVMIDGPGRVIKKRGVDGILLKNTGNGNMVRSVTWQGFNASMTGSISGTTLTVTAIVGTLRYVADVIPHGAMLSGAGINPRTMVVGQVSGTAGGVGVYTLNVDNGTLASRTIRFTDAPTFNQFNDLVQNRDAADFTLADAILDGSAGGGAVNYNGLRCTFRALTVTGVHDNGWLCANTGLSGADIGADDFVADDIDVNGTGNQNCGFITASAGSLTTTSVIRRPKITRIRHDNAGDTCLEIGQNTLALTGGDWTLGNSRSATLLFRDVDTVTVSRIVITPPAYADQADAYSPIAVVPYHKADTINSRISLSGVAIATGKVKRGGIYIGQGGVTLSGVTMDTGAGTGDRNGTFLVLAGNVSNVDLSNSVFAGFATFAITNFGFTTPVTIGNIGVRDNQITNYDRLSFSSNVTFNGLRWIGNTTDRSGATDHEITGGAFAATATNARVIVADRAPSRFSPDTLPRDGLITSLNTIPVLLPGTSVPSADLGDVRTLAGKIVTVTIVGSGATASFMVGVDFVTKLAGTSTIEAQPGTSAGWVVRIASNRLELARQAAATTAGVALVNVGG